MMDPTPPGARNARIIVALLSLVVVACGRAGPSAEAVAAALWLPPLAIVETDAARPVEIENGRSVYVDGTGAVSFSISGECDDVARQIDEHFAATKWQRRSTQYLNPQQATSFRSGCQLVSEPYRQWWGEWENGQGDIITYVVGGMGQQLHGYASYDAQQNVEKHSRRTR